MKKYFRAVIWLSRRLLPLLLRKMLREFFAFVHCHLLLRSFRYRKKYVISQIEKLRLLHDGNYKWSAETRLKCAVLWEQDGRMLWLGIAARDRDIGLLFVPRSIYRTVFTCLLAKNGYRSDLTKGEVSLQAIYKLRFEKYRSVYLEYCKSVATILEKQYQFDAYILPKLADDWIIDVIKGMLETGQTVVVNDREHFVTPKRMEMWPKHFEAIMHDLLVDQIYATSERQAEFFAKCAYPSDRIIVTGRPDDDCWFRGAKRPTRKEIHSRISNDKINLLFFAFGKFNYLNTYYLDETRDWGYLASDYHQVLLDLIRRHSNLQILYKIGGKPARDNFPGFEKFYDKAIELGGKDCVIKLDGSYSTPDLLSISDFVVGFQTTALLQAMFTNQPILYGAWGSLYRDHKNTLMPVHEWPGLEYLNSKDALQAACEKVIEGINIGGPLRVNKKMLTARHRLLHEQMYMPDGNASNRILDEIEVLISSKEGV